MALPVNTCLQCEQSREEVRRDKTICGIEDGYEYRELVAEWPRHHWRDWSDAELTQAGIKPEFFELYRRWSISAIGYADCDHIQRGHTYPEKDVYYDEHLMHPKNMCMTCGERKDAAIGVSVSD